MDVRVLIIPLVVREFPVTTPARSPLPVVSRPVMRSFVFAGLAGRLLVTTGLLLWEVRGTAKRVSPHAGPPLQTAVATEPKRAERAHPVETERASSIRTQFTQTYPPDNRL